MDRITNKTIDVSAIETEAKRRLAQRVPDNATWFVASSKRLMTIVPTADTASALVEAHIACMRYFLNSPERMFGAAVGEHAALIAEKYSLKSQERLLCNLTGILYKDAGRHVKAIDSFVRGIGIARRIGSKIGEANIWANMASSANMMGLFEDAMKFARRALALIAAENDAISVDVRVVASQILSRACLTLGRMDEAIVAIRNAGSQLPIPKTTFDYVNRIRLHHAHTVIALKMELVDEAKQATSQALADLPHCGGVNATVHATVCEAMVAAAGGEIEKADKLTAKMLEDYGSESSLLHDLFAARLYVLDKAECTEDATALRDKFRGEWQRKKMRDVIAQLSSLDESNASNSAYESQAVVRERLEELAIVGELHDDSTGEHAFRVGRLAGLLARRIGMSAFEADRVDIAARLHDIGKVTTPPEILTKPGPLTANERDVMKNHTLQGHAILATRHDPLIEMASQIALYHHEWWDGNGYPEGLKGDAIPKIAQITALADVFDALSHPRCYKPAWSINASLAEIGRLSSGGTHQQFNTDLANSFAALIRELVERFGEDGLDNFLSERSVDSQFFSVRAAAGESLQSTVQSVTNISSR
jgi:putative two-component system response regulator